MSFEQVLNGMPGLQASVASEFYKLKAKRDEVTKKYQASETARRSSEAQLYEAKSRANDHLHRCKARTEAFDKLKEKFRSVESDRDKAVAEVLELQAALSNDVDNPAESVRNDHELLVGDFKQHADTFNSRYSHFKNKCLSLRGQRGRSTAVRQSLIELADLGGTVAIDYEELMKCADRVVDALIQSDGDRSRLQQKLKSLGKQPCHCTHQTTKASAQSSRQTPAKPEIDLAEHNRLVGENGVMQKEPQRERDTLSKLRWDLMKAKEQPLKEMREKDETIVSLMRTNHQLEDEAGQMVTRLANYRCEFQAQWHDKLVLEKKLTAAGNTSEWLQAGYAEVQELMQCLEHKLYTSTLVHQSDVAELRGDLQALVSEYFALEQEHGTTSRELEEAQDKAMKYEQMRMLFDGAVSLDFNIRGAAVRPDGHPRKESQSTTMDESITANHSPPFSTRRTQNAHSGQESPLSSIPSTSSSDLAGTIFGDGKRSVYDSAALQSPLWDDQPNASTAATPSKPSFARCESINQYINHGSISQPRRMDSRAGDKRQAVDGIEPPKGPRSSRVNGNGHYKRQRTSLLDSYRPT
jgi:hypothetical protein